MVHGNRLWRLIEPGGFEIENGLPTPYAETCAVRKIVTLKNLLTCSLWYTGFDHQVSEHISLLDKHQTIFCDLLHVVFKYYLEHT